MKQFTKNFGPFRRNKKKAYLYAHWHEDIPMLSTKFGFSNMCTMASLSRDGEIIANVLNLIGFRMVRASTIKGFRHAFQEMKQAYVDGWNLVLAVDGPHGPRHEVKAGALYIGKNTEITIFPVVGNAKHKITFRKSWDKMWIPLPFSQAIMMMGDPIHFTGRETKESMRQKRLQLESELNTLKSKVNAYFS